MKCDVCLTHIPVGEDTCPKCGYKIRKEHTSVYDASGKTHEHIQVQQRMRKYTHSSASQSKNMLLKNIIMIIGIVVIISCAFVFFINMINTDSNESVDFFENTDIEDMTFETIIEEGYDDDSHTVETALDYHDGLFNYVWDSDARNIEDNKWVDMDGFYMRALTSLDYDLHDYHYTVMTEHQEGELVKVQLEIRGKFYANREILHANQEDVNGIAGYIGMEITYDDLKDYHEKMVKNADIYEYALDTDSSEIYMSEKYYNTDKPYYWLNYSITEYL